MILALAIVLALAGCQPDRPLTEEEKSRIQQRFQETIDSRGFSGAVYAVYRGEVIYDGGAGMAADTPENGTDVAYAIASVTKQFTAAAIMQLYEQEKLDLTDPIGKYFPDYRYGDKICIKHLLSQRSGIPDYMVDMDRTGKYVVISVVDGGDKYVLVDVNHTAEENQEIIREFFLSRKLRFEPGARFDYSDSNFALLAEIVSQVSGMSYHEYVRQNIFEPLGMEHSGFIDDYDKETITKVADADRSEFSIDYFTIKGAEYGCGDILTTPQDLYLWYRGLTDGTVVSKGAYQLMTANYSNSLELGYGFGLMISDKSESKVVYHYGYVPSYYSAAIYVPAYDYCEIVLSNRADGSPHGMASDLAEYFGSVIDLKLTNID